MILSNWVVVSNYVLFSAQFGDDSTMTDSTMAGWQRLVVVLFKKTMFTPNLGEDEPILTSIFFKGVETTNLLDI